MTLALNRRILAAFVLLPIGIVLTATGAVG